VRADSEATDALLRRAFADRVVDDVDAPPNYSVVLHDDAGSRGVRQLHQLFRASSLVTRSRDHGRIVHALAAHLSAHLDDEPTSDPESGLLQTIALGAVAGSNAYLLPRWLLSSLKTVQPRLNRLGVQLVDGPRTLVDATTGELVVPEPAVTVDPSVAAELAPSGKRSPEPPAIAPGRYPLRSWACAVRDTDRASARLSRARAVGETLGSLYFERDQARAVLEVLVDLFDRVPPIGVTFAGPDALVTELGELIDA
jgi:hypothetical protein